MRFKVGDKIRVRKDLTKGYYDTVRGNGDEDDVYCPDDMLEFAGKVLTVKSVDTKNGVYSVEETTWVWCDEMLDYIAVDSDNTMNTALVIENLITKKVCNYQNVERIEFDGLGNHLTFEYYDDTMENNVTMTIHIDNNIRFFTVKGCDNE